MKKIYKKIWMYLIILFIFIVFDNFVFKLLSSINYYSVIFWVANVFLVYKLIGYEKDKQIFKVDIIQTVFIYSIMYFLFIYLLGIYTGFLRSPYVFNIYTIVKIILPLFIIILAQEFLRYLLVTKSKNSKALLIIIPTIFIFVEIVYGLNTNLLKDYFGIFEMIGCFIIPTIVNNYLLTYLSLKSGYKATMLYRALFELYIYILPFSPDLGVYIDAVLKLFLPFFLYSKISKAYVDTSHHTHKKENIPLIIITFIMLITVVAIVSGLFKYFALSIGSGSMSPSINKGDVVVAEKIDSKDDLKKGDVIIFSYDNELIVHRIASITKNNNDLIIRTKGDYNKEEDKFYVKYDSIKGKMLCRIPIIGYPAVWVSELMG